MTMVDAYMEVGGRAMQEQLAEGWGEGINNE